MRKAMVLDADDIKKIIAEKFDVDIKDVIKSQYSYTVILKKEAEDNNSQTLTT